MPSWKKLVVSGSDTHLNSLNVNTFVSASNFAGDGSGITGVISSSYAVTASYIDPTFISASAAALGFGGGGGGTTPTGSLLVTASAVGSTITFEKGDGSTFDVNIVASGSSADSLVTASISSNILTFTKGDSSTFSLLLPSSSAFIGESSTAHLSQSIAADTWSFAHNLNDRYPVVTVYDENEDIIIPNVVSVVDENNLNIIFTTARTGYATAVVVGVSSSYAATASYSDNFNAVSASIYALSASFIDFDLNPTTEPQEGRLVWNADDGTLDLGLGNTTLQVGQEQYWYVRNNTASPIANGAAVMATGTLGASTRLTAAPMIADGTVPAKFFLGVATQEIPAGEDGYVTTFGKVRNINTSSYPTGSVLWCDPDNPGGLTVDEPVAPNLKLPVAFTISSTNNGSIAVRATTGVRLSNSHDVQFTSASYGDLILQSGSVWINTKHLSGSYVITGSLTADSFTGDLVGTASYATTASYAISASHEITFELSSSHAEVADEVPFTGITGKPTLLSGSAQIASDISGSFTLVSSSIASDIEDIIDGTTTVTSASYALTASYALNAGGGTGVGFPFSGSAIITGSLIVSSSFVDFTNTTVISGSIFSGSFVGNGSGLTDLGFGDTKKLNQAVAATTWSFSHNMNEQYPTVTVYNGSNEVVQPSKIEAVDAQTLRLYFGIPTAGTAVAVVGGTATTQEAGFNRVFTQGVAATTWSFEHNLGNKYPQVIVYDSSDELVIPGKVEAIDQNNLTIYFDTPQAGTATATVGGTSLTASYADSLVITDTLLTTQQNTDVDTGIETVATVSTTFYDGAFFDYVLKDGTNYRAGTVTAVWDGSSVQFSEISTADIGNTNSVTMSVDISGTDARLRATVGSDNWNVKAFVRAL